MISFKVQLQPLDSSSKCQRQREWWGKHDRVHFISIIPVRGDSCSWQSRNLYFASENQEHRLKPCKGFSILAILLQLCFRHSKNVFLTPITLNIHLYFASSGSSGEVLVHLWHLWLLAPDEPLPRPQNLSRLVSTTIYTLLKLWQCGTRRWPDKESKDWEHTSCEIGKLHSLHKWFSFAMRMKVWSWKSSPKTPSDLSPTRLKDEFENRGTAVEAFNCM